MVIPAGAAAAALAAVTDVAPAVAVGAAPCPISSAGAVDAAPAVGFDADVGNEEEDWRTMVMAFAGSNVGLVGQSFCSQMKPLQDKC